MSEEPEKKHNEPVRRVIPKFSSFKPAATSVAAVAPQAHRAPPEESKKKSEGGQHERRRHHRSGSPGHERRHRRDKDRERDGKDRRSKNRMDRDDSHRRHRRRSKTPPASEREIQLSSKALRSPSPESWDEPKKPYFLDTKGDHNNLVYGTIHRYEIPIYHRHGAGRVIGLSNDAKIDKEKGDGKGLVISTKDSRQGYTSVKRGWNAFAKLESEGVRKLKVKADDTGLEEAFSRQLDFVPLTARTRKRKRNGGSATADEDDDEEDSNHYRSIEGPKKILENPEDDDLEFVSDSASDEDYVSIQAWGDTKRMVELTRKVESESKNIAAWLEYVNYQDTLQQTSGRRKTAAERMSTAEIKLDILSKALQKCPGNETLLVKYMDVATDIWDSQKLKTKWEKILGENTSLIGLWKKYLDFRQTDFLSFKYPECLKCFADCITVLRSAVFKKGFGDREQLEEIIVYVFCRSALLMNEAGYGELAVASFQAMLELNFFRPPQIGNPLSAITHEAILDEFEKFWDSEVLRVGEAGSVGWSSFVITGVTSTMPDPIQENLDLPALDQDDPFGSWTDAEVEFSNKVGKPARTIDEVEEDDPYRVVLFSDLRAVMYAFSSARAKEKLIEAFLQFYHLPPLASVSSNDVTRVDPFFRNDFMRVTGLATFHDWLWPNEERQSRKLLNWEGMEPVKKAGAEENPFVFKMQNTPRSAEATFNKSGVWFGGCEGMKMSNSRDRQLVGNVMEQVVRLANSEELSLYYLAWKWENSPESAKKAAKSLLKRSKTSLRLWSAYAQMEWYDGNQDVARNVFSTALGMTKGFPESSARDSIVLWNAWLWAELECGNMEDVVRVALSIESGKPMNQADVGGTSSTAADIPKAMLLKADNYLEQRQSEMLSMRYFEHAGLFNQARALLAYVVKRDFSVITIFDDYMTELERRHIDGSLSLEYEICLMRKMRLLYYHARTAKIFKMSLLRDVLDSAIKLFGQNTAFLALYTWNESRTKVENRVRTLLRDHVLVDGKETVVGWLFAIWAELNMSHNWNVHAVRNLFRRAVECKNTCANAQLWLFYVEFEIRQGEPGKAKEILFQAIQNCPWSKAIFMTAFIKLRSALEFEDMSKLLSIISSEKELRVHDVTEIEDMVEDMSNDNNQQRQAMGHAKNSDVLRLPNDADTDEMDET